MSMVTQAAAAFATGYAAMRVAELPRTKRAAHVFRGRPLAYRITIDRGTLMARDHTLIEECALLNTSVAPRLVDTGRAPE